MDRANSSSRLSAGLLRAVTHTCLLVSLATITGCSSSAIPDGGGVFAASVPSVTPAECQDNGGLLLDSGTSRCITSTMCTGRTNGNQFINTNGDTCVSACSTGEGVDNADTCTTTPSVGDCVRAGQLLSTANRCTAACGATQGIRSNQCVTDPTVPAECLANFGRLLDMGTQVCITSAQCTNRGTGNRYINAAAELCVSMCVATEGRTTAGRCTTTPTGEQCQENGGRLLDSGTTTCITSTTCTARPTNNQYINAGTQTCVAMCETTQGLVVATKTCTPAPTAVHCQANGGRLLDSGTTNCITGAMCTARGSDNQYISAGTQTCVAACEAAQGLITGTKTCTTTPTATHCQANGGAFLRGGVCVAMCLASDGVRGGATCVTDPIAAECQANGGRLLDRGTTTCITGAMCTARSDNNQYISAGTQTCVAACEAAQGLITATKTCTTTPTAPHCQANGGAFLRGGGCVAMCLASDGLRATHTCVTDPTGAECQANGGRLLDGGTTTCITGAMCTARSDNNQYINADTHMCVTVCDVTQGLDATTKTCIATPTAEACRANGGQVYNADTRMCEMPTACTGRGSGNRFISNSNCVAECPTNQGATDDGECTSTDITAMLCENADKLLRGGVCVDMCLASDGVRDGNECVTTNPTAGECVANGGLLSVSTTNCIAGNACVAPNFINNANACVAACPATQGADGTRNCTATITPTNCGNAARFLKAGNCVAMCEGTEFINVDNNTCVADCGMLGANSSRMCLTGTPNVTTCGNANTFFDGDTDTCVMACTGTRTLVNSAENECVSMCATAEGVRGGACVTDPIAAECQANGGRLLDGGTTTCITGTMCTARGSDNQYISAGTQTCVAMCEAAQGLIIGTKTCTTTPTATHCQDNNGAFLRGSVCVAMCEASDGVRDGNECVTTNPTAGECVANGGLLSVSTTNCIAGNACVAPNFINNANACVAACPATQGADGTRNCTATITPTNCGNAARFLSAGNCVDMCEGTEFINVDNNTCVADCGMLGANSSRMCLTGTPNVTTCGNANTLFDGDTNTCVMSCTGTRTLVNSAENECVSMCATAEGVRGGACVTDPIAAECQANGGRLLDSGTTTCITGTMCTARGSDNQYISAGTQTCVAMCEAAQGLIIGTKTCTTTPTATHCQDNNGAFLRGTACVTMCQASDGVRDGNECVTTNPTAGECAANGGLLSVSTTNCIAGNACVAPNFINNTNACVTECPVNQGADAARNCTARITAENCDNVMRFLRGAVCVAMCQASDGLRGDNTCVTSNPTAGECAANGAILSFDTTNCIASDACGGMNVINENACVTACPANQGADGEGNCTTIITAENCGNVMRFLRGAVCVAACQASDGERNDNECVTSNPSGDECQANGGAFLRGDGCVVACVASDGLRDTHTCVTSNPTGDECQDNGGAFLRGGGCVAMCRTADGLRDTHTCVTSNPTGDECQANGGAFLRGSGCVVACRASDGLQNAHTCITSNPTAGECAANGGLLSLDTINCIASDACVMPNFISNANACVAACPANQGADSARNCTTTITAENCDNVMRFLRGAVCVSACEASDGLQGDNTCVTSNPTAGECAANGGLLSLDTTTCIASNACGDSNFISQNACVAACPANQGADSARNCTATITPTNCGNAMRFLKGGNCVAMCEGTEFINVDNNTCVADCGALGANMSRQCLPGTPNVGTCSNANTLFDGSMNRCVTMCSGSRALINSAENECISACPTEEGLRVNACVTDPSANECVANGGLLSVSTTNCIAGNTCVAPNFINNANACVAACPANQGADGTRNCTATITPTNCGNAARFLKAGNCVDMCEGTEFINVDNNTCVADCGMLGANSSRMCQPGTPNVVTCSNANTLFDGSTNNCVTACTGTRDLVNSAENECISMCPAAEGLRGGACVIDPIAAECQANGGAFLRGSVCVAMCQASDGLRDEYTCVTDPIAAECQANGGRLLDGGTTTCITGTMCTARADSNQYISAGTHTCVAACEVAQGLIIGTKTCTTTPTATHCQDNNGAFLRGTACVTMCEASDGLRGDDTCVTSNPSAGECAANDGRLLSLDTTNCIASDACVAPNFINNANACVAECPATQGADSTRNCTTTITATNCGNVMRFLKGGACVNMCESTEFINTDNNTCVATCGMLGANSSRMCQPGTPNVVTCSNANTLFDGDTDTCVASCTGTNALVNSAENECVSMCATAEGVRGGACVTDPTAVECVANSGAFLRGSVCVAMCEASDGLRNSNECVTDPTGTECVANEGALLRGGSCVAMCEASDGLRNSNECVTDPIAVECVANEGAFLRGGSCVAMCQASDGLRNSNECVTDPTGTECVANEGAFLRGSVCVAMCQASDGLRDTHTCVTDPIAADCQANGGRLLDSGTTTCITGMMCTGRADSNQYISAGTHTCVAACEAAQGLIIGTKTCTTTPTATHCQDNDGALLRGSVCVAMCETSDGLRNSNECVTDPTAGECAANDGRLLSLDTTNCIASNTCVAPNFISESACVAECPANQGADSTRNCTVTVTAENCDNVMRFLRGDVCVSACQASDGLQGDNTCVTSNPSAGECAANGGGLLSVDTTTCIASDACGNPNFISENACVAVCPANQGADNTRNCTTTITATNCGNVMRFLKGGNCVDMCEGTEFINVDNNTCVADCGMLGANSSRRCLTGTPNVGTCSNANTFFDGSTNTCVASCTGTRALVNSDENECVSMCATAEGVRGGACVTDPTATECVANSGAFLRGLVCVAMCEDSDGLRNSNECVTDPTGAECVANEGALLRGGSCVAMCEASDGLRNSNECVTDPTGAECVANSGAFLRGSACVAMCQASDGLRDTHTCVTDPIAAECQANGGRLLDSGTTTCITGTMCTARGSDNQYISAGTHTCVAACEVAQGLIIGTKTCTTTPTATHCQDNNGAFLRGTACVTMCEASDGLRGGDTCVTSNPRAGECDANGGRLLSIDTTTCIASNACGTPNFISESACVVECPATQGADAARNCTTTITAENCGNVMRFLSGGNCVFMCESTEFINVDNNTCVADCGMLGANTSRMCQPGTPNVVSCSNAGTLFDGDTNTCVASCTGTNTLVNSAENECVSACETAEGVRDGVCVTDPTAVECVANGELLRGSVCVAMCEDSDGLRNSNECVTDPTVGECAAHGMRLLDGEGGMSCVTRGACINRDAGNRYASRDGETCTAACGPAEGVLAGGECTSTPGPSECERLMLVLLRTDTCGENQNCPSGYGLVDNTCTDVTDLEDNNRIEACNALGQTVRGKECLSRAIPIIEAFRGEDNSGITSPLIDSSAFDDSSTLEEKRQREYANQPSLDIVGAAFAYGEIGKREEDLDAALEAGFGKGSSISVITNKRFDATHPEFDSASTAVFDTLVRFHLLDQSGTAPYAAGPQAVLTSPLDSDDSGLIRIYQSGATDSGVYFTLPVAQIMNVNFESFHRTQLRRLDASGIARSDALAAVLDSLASGSAVGFLGFSGGRYYLASATSIFINWDLSRGYQLIGRDYGDDSNIASYQIVLEASANVRDNDDSGECIVDNSCYANNMPQAATAAEMGLFALINGLMNPNAPNVESNTHGIAPAAKLNVFTSRVVGATWHNSTDLIYRARGIDVGRDRNMDGDLIADETRNIALVQNGIAASSATGNVGANADNVDAIVADAAAYELLYKALQVGLADNEKQDAYVFAARDGNAADVGLLAGLPIATGSGFEEYSIIVVAVEDDQTPCGSNAQVQAICIAAPGDYTYRDRMDDGSYTTTLETATSANAAASLVAGGLALLESVFSGETTARLIDRLLLTASKDYDLNEDGDNDYAQERHGRGLMDLACAVTPITSLESNLRATAGCVDRFASVSSIVEAFRGTDRIAVTSSLIDSSAFDDSSTILQKRQREYANQPSLDKVGAAFAYGIMGEKEGTRINDIAKILGQGSSINVITNKRFDPTHPEFASSASDASFLTLTRFNAQGSGQFVDGSQALLPKYFSLDIDKVIQVYELGTSSNRVYFTLPVGQINGMDFEDISRTEFADAEATALRTALQNIIRPLVGGDGSFTIADTGGVVTDDGRSYELDTNGRYIIALARFNTTGFQHIGRIYGEGSNIGSYQLLIDPRLMARDDDDEGECAGVPEGDSTVDDGTSCYSAFAPVQANAADMGLLALINGLMNPNAPNVQANTHGIAPGARLNVVSIGGSNYHTIGALLQSDMIYRARGIDVGRDRNMDGDLIADGTRNIVVIQNNYATSTGDAVDSVTGLNNFVRNFFDGMYKALQVGVADTRTQDAYVFAAPDVSPTLGARYAAIALSDIGVSLKEYSIIVVAAEARQTTCGGNNYEEISDICIAAPGRYNYRTKGSNSAYGGGDDDLASAISANAAASLVAGGLALLESVFSGETTARLIDRLFLTASKSYDLNDDGSNDYSSENHGQGLMDLACALKPITSLDSDIRRNADCVDRFKSKFGDNDEIVEAFRGEGNTSVFSSLIYSRDFNDSSSTEEKRQREYANQPSLDRVGAAFAYGRIGSKKSVDIDGIVDVLGKGNQISVITNKRFDPTHPEFTSSDESSFFRTLTRLEAYGMDSDFATMPQNLLTQFFAGDDNNVVEVYENGATDTAITFTVPMFQTNGEDFESVSRTAFLSGSSVRIAFLAFINTLVGDSGGGSFIVPSRGSLSKRGNGYSYVLDADGNYVIFAVNDGDEAASYQHVGRLYGDEINIASYQIIFDSSLAVRDDDDSGECITDNDCYATHVPEAATAAEMGLFALINGLMNPNAPNVEANTHGIAPGATLNVFTSPAVGATGYVSNDLIYRARGIDVGRDRDTNGVLIADETRNIVLVQNGMASSEIRASASIGTDTRTIDAIVADELVYKGFYEALRVGLADDEKQDAYVFAARDGNATDVGLLAGLSIATNSGFKEYSIIVVAVENDQTPCGDNAQVQAICIAAPGAYTYRTRADDGSYTTTLETATSANAAASLVAGGLALLESVFSGETTTRLIDRLLLTASKEYDLDVDGDNNYSVIKHGRGLMDLACAVTPITRLDGALRASAGCLDRFAFRNIIVEAFRGEGNSVVTTSLIDSSAFDDTSTVSQRRQREYANQPSLDIVGAAFAYGDIGKNEKDVDAALAKGFGKGSHVSVITNKRFDATHPEFASSARSATFRTLTRFTAEAATGSMIFAVSPQGLLTAIFDNDSNGLVQVYESGASQRRVYFTLSVGQLSGVSQRSGRNFESYSRIEFTTNDFNIIVARGRLTNGMIRPLSSLPTDSFSLVGVDRYVIRIDELDNVIYLGWLGGGDVLGLGFNHVGRLYGDGSNIASYQIVLSPTDNVRFSFDSGECIPNNDNCYTSDVPVAASGAEMGLLALINGLMNPTAPNVQANTHGIAPGATLSVFTSPAVGATGHISNDLIYRARGIDVGRDRTMDGDLIADETRNIVLVQNGIAAIGETGYVGTNADNVDAVVADSARYESFYKALQVGLRDNKQQDAYVFAARDGNAADVGLLAALPIATNSGFKEYSIIVVALETTVPCGRNLDVQAICIAAPGEYKYRDRAGDGSYGTTLETATSANAAASLVAGGLALLESIFPDEPTSVLIDRLLLTASKEYDLDEDGDNDYSAIKHGQGLMDLACAVTPITSIDSTLRTRAGCVDRFKSRIIPTDNIVEALRGEGKAAVTSPLIDSSAFDDSSTVLQRRQREYANQPSLDIVGAAFVYDTIGEKESVNINDLASTLGQGSHISVITNKRFDPRHPEFASSIASNAFRTLTRFFVTSDTSSVPGGAPELITSLFPNDDNGLIQIYYSSPLVANRSFRFTMPVGQIDGMDFESYARSELFFDNPTNNARNNKLGAFINALTRSESVEFLPRPQNLYVIRTSDDTYSVYLAVISSLGGLGFNHVGRLYGDGSNIASYQIVLNTDVAVRRYTDSGECLNDSCYTTGVSASATAAEMGVLALISGLMNPTASNVHVNTHGIAPGAELNVFTAPPVGATWHISNDLIYRARSIDFGRDRNVAGDLIADDTRNIVLVQNGIADSSQSGDVGTNADNVDAVVITTAPYEDFYKALQVGLADNKEQDAYVFAARDGNAADVGLLAGLPIVTNSGFKEYSIIVVAAEDDQTPCGDNAQVQAICITAPGEYTYRTRANNGSYTTTLETATSANAAASLVAGGLALLESIFPTEKTARLIDRLFVTASKNYDLNDDGSNDYTQEKHGQGLMDLACAATPMTSLDSTLRASAGCVDRFAPKDSIVEFFRGSGNSDVASPLIDSSAFDDSSTVSQRRRREYANQPSLDTVGAAFAYDTIGEKKAVGISNIASTLGQGSQISVVTNKRFDPTHPEFSSATDSDYRTLTKFVIQAGQTGFVMVPQDVVTTFFTRDSEALVQVYQFRASSSRVFFTLPVGTIDGMSFEDFSRTLFSADDATGLARRAELMDIMRPLLCPSPCVTTLSSVTGYVINLTGTFGNSYLIYFGDTVNPSRGYQHVGRVYGDDSNIVSYEIVYDTLFEVRDNDDSGECITDNACYADDVPEAATAAEMGLLALINGLMNPRAPNVQANTHGIAPGARLRVITSPAVRDGREIGSELIYRARGIDVGRDRMGSELTADDTRNIVLVQNTVAAMTGDIGRGRGGVDSGASDSATYQDIYKGLQVGIADNKKQDAYVFAARDGNAPDPGLLAGLPIATGSGFIEYSIIVVAVEDQQTPCGFNTAVLPICIAAPGKYTYRTRADDGSYTTTLETATSANAAASLVAGGLALLESIFSDDTTARLIDRLLLTASKDYDLNDDGSNDYVQAKHGQGLMDLACAATPITSLDSNLRTAAGCVDRFAAPAGTSAPPQNQQQNPAEGVPLAEEDFASGYCNIEGLRIILSGDVCSGDYILLADKEGNLIPDVIGNLRFGMGFGDSLLQGIGITFFDVLDTAWTVDNPYNPYVELLDFTNIVVAPVESRFDIDDRFYAVREGTRPGTRKTWVADTASITIDFATQGMATKPEGVTRGQIRNTLTHDNFGADPYSEVRFMLSAEDTLGGSLGRLKVMTYSGMAMGYALGLHAQGDAMMPSYLLTNRDSFHAPYLSLASSGLGGGMTYRFRDGGHIGFVMGEGTSLNADGTLPQQQQTERPRAFAGMMEYAPHENLMVHLGALQEESTLLASQGSGLFDIQGGTTAFVGVQAKQPISDDWQILVSGYGGRTQLDGSRGIVTGLDVVTSSFDVGLLGSGLLDKGDHLLLRAGQPMRVEMGSLDLSYVSSRRGGAAGTQSFSVAPSKRSVEVGVGYGMAVGKDGHMRFAVDYVHNPGHRRMRGEVFGIMSFHREF